MNPWLILAAVLALAGVGLGGEVDGRNRGVNKQKVADQAQFDKVNAALTQQKALAQKIISLSEAHALDDQRHNVEIHQDLERQHAIDQGRTDAVRQQLASRELRFSAPASAGCGPRGADGVLEAASAASAAGTAVVQLPTEVARPLRQLNLEADALADSYRECFAYEAAVAAWLKANP